MRSGCSCFCSYRGCCSEQANAQALEQFVQSCGIVDHGDLSGMRKNGRRHCLNAIVQFLKVVVFCCRNELLQYRAGASFTQKCYELEFECLGVAPTEMCGQFPSFTGFSQVREVSRSSNLHGQCSDRGSQRDWHVSDVTVLRAKHA